MYLVIPLVFAALAQENTNAAGSVLGSSGIGLLDWAVAASILAVGVVSSVLVRRAVVAVLRRGTTVETITERLVGRLAQTVVVVLALAYALTALDVRIGPLLGALGIGGLAVALALQETLKNLFVGVILHPQRPVNLGEEIVTGDMQGTVVAITSRAVTLRSNSGRWRSRRAHRPGPLRGVRRLERELRHRFLARTGRAGPPRDNQQCRDCSSSCARRSGHHHPVPAADVVDGGRFCDNRNW